MKDGAALNLEANDKTKIIIYRNLFFDNLSRNAALLWTIFDESINLLASNFLIQNYGSDALPYQKPLININTYFAPGNGAGAVIFKSYVKNASLVSLSNIYYKNFAFKTGNAFFK